MHIQRDNVTVIGTEPHMQAGDAIAAPVAILFDHDGTPDTAELKLSVAQALQLAADLEAAARAAWPLPDDEGAFVLEWHRERRSGRVVAVTIQPKDEGLRRIYGERFEGDQLENLLACGQADARFNPWDGQLPSEECLIAAAIAYWQAGV